MPLDGALLSQIAHEIKSMALEARIDRIAQPYRDEIILHLRWRGGAKKLLLSASASNPRIHFTEKVPENPQSPPMFCMLLRKHLSGARLTDIRQEGMDRILFLDFEAMNELGDIVTLTLVHEIRGQHSNIILVDETGKVLDAVRRVGFERSDGRHVLPNMSYHLPPGQEKLNLLEASVDDVTTRLKTDGETALSRGIMNALEGMSPLPSREIAHRAAGDDVLISELTQPQWEAVRREIAWLQSLLVEHHSVPTMLLEEDGRPKDFTFLPIEQYGTLVPSESMDSYSILLDSFYHKRNTMDKMRQLSSSLHRSVKNIHDRIVRRVASQQRELLATKEREHLRILGDIITGNIYALKKGQKEATLQNFYSEEGEELTIALDPFLSPADNAQAYYSKYRKADTAEKILTKQIASGKEELAYIESVLDVLARATRASDLEGVREELIDSGYVRRQTRKKRTRPAKQTPHTYVSSDGFSILSGRNNVQNDQLTTKNSQKNDIWLHTKNMPGSHTVIVTENRQVPNRTLEEAAVIAAYHSSAQDSVNVPVDYTEIRFVKKQSGAKPGMVHYENFKTVVVTPDEKLVSSLEKM